MGTTFCKFCQPNLLTIPSGITESYYTDYTILSFDLNISSPLIQILQSVHDMICISIIVMGGQVVNSASKNLTLSKKWIKPVGVSSSWSWTNKDLIKVTNIIWKFSKPGIPCLGRGFAVQSKQQQPPLVGCQTGPCGWVHWIPGLCGRKRECHSYRRHLYVV